MDERRGFFETLANDWDDQQPTDREEVLRRLLAPFDHTLEDSQMLLEIGSGTGALIPILRVLAPYARIVSIDLAYGMLHRARQRCPDAALLQADAHFLPLPDLQFDFAICHNSYAHFSDKAAALSNLRAVLSPKGKLLILHDINREQVNKVHLCVNAQVIHNDLLPAAEQTKHLLETAGFTRVHTWDTEDRYAAIGTRA